MKKFLSLCLLIFGVILVTIIYFLYQEKDFSPSDNSAATIYYLSPSGSDNNPGTSTSPWKTMSYADTKAVAGDTIILKDGTYPAYVRLEKSGITWRAQNKHKAILDGGFAPDMLNDNWDNIVTLWNNKCSTIGRFAALISMRNTNNVTLDGLYLRNSCGRGLGITTESGGTMHNVSVRNTKIDWTISSGLYANPDESVSDYPAKMTNFQFIDNEMTRTSVGDEYHVRVPGACQPKGTPLSQLELKYCVNISVAIGGYDSVVRGNIFAWGEGELSPQPGIKGILFENNTVVGNKNSFYAGMVEDAIVRNNIFYAPEEKKPKAGNTDVDATGFWRMGLRNEKGHLKTGKKMNTNIVFYNNYIINTGFFITGSNKTHLGDNNQIYFGGNTLVAGKELSDLLNINHASNTSGDPKLTGIIENNIFDTRKNTNAKIAVKLSGNDELTIRNNIFPKSVESSIKGAGNIFVNDPGLTNPTVLLTIKYPGIGPSEININEILNGVNLSNYLLTGSSPSRDKGTTLGNISSTNIPSSARNQDYFGNSRVGAPDIGASEYLQSNSIITSPTPAQTTLVTIRARAIKSGSSTITWPRLEVLSDDTTLVNTPVATFAINTLRNKDYQFTYNGDFDISKHKFKFVNDNGTADLGIDYVKVGKKIYQTENARTLSTGTWNSTAKACISGFYSSEILQCNGYFDYSP